jgi:RHS repeat-associated protein
MDSTGALKSTTYTFDPLDRTVSETADGKTTNFEYLGLSNEVLDEKVAGTLTKSYQYSPWGERLSQVKYNSDGTTEDGYYGYNSHTDVETLTDKNGDAKATYGYTAYGSDDKSEFTGIDKPNAGDPTKEAYNPYRFNAKRWDAKSGTYDMGFRDYDPGLNRFTTRDMYDGALADMDLGTDPFTSNRYAFAGGNPVSGIEIDGHTSVDALCDGVPGCNAVTSGRVEATEEAKKKGRAGEELAADRIRHDAAVQAMAAFLRAQYAQIPDVQVLTEYYIPGAQRKNGKGGRADIVLIWGDDMFVWEMKSVKTAEEDGPATLDRYINAMRKNEEKKTFGRTVQRGWELPQIATMDPLNVRQQLVAQSTRTRPGSTRTSAKFQGVVGWWTRKQQTRAPRGMEPVTVPAPLTIQAWQPTPEQQKRIAWGAIATGTLYVFGKMLTDPFGVSG